MGYRPKPARLFNTYLCVRSIEILVRGHKILWEFLWTSLYKAVSSPIISYGHNRFKASRWETAPGEHMVPQVPSHRLE